MVISDIALKGNTWEFVLNGLQPRIIKTYYGVYALCVAIGIMYDKQESFDNEDNEEHKSVPRTVLWQNKEELEMLFQTAILTTNCVDYSEDERLEMAFGNECIQKDFNELQFLTKFANYGAVVLKDRIAESDIETMNNIKNFITSTFEGTNFDINPLTDEEIDISEEDLQI